MNLNKYTEKAQEAVLAAQTMAQEYGQQSIEPEHLLLALIQQQDGIATPLITAAGGSAARLRDLTERNIKDKPKVSGATGDVRMSREVSVITDKAEAEAEQMKDDYVSTEHLLIALADPSTFRTSRPPRPPVC